MTHDTSIHRPVVGPAFVKDAPSEEERAMHAESMARQIQISDPRDHNAYVVLPDGRLASNIRFACGRMEHVDGVSRFVEDPSGSFMGMKLTVRGADGNDVLP